MDTNRPNENDMHLDRTAGQDDLETATSRVGGRSQRRFGAEQTTAALVTQAATCAVHGCCDGEWSVEEAERWDGLA